MDHGSDWLGDDVPPEELNRLEEGKDYGWPFVWGDRRTIPLESHPRVGKLAAYALKTTPPVLGYQAHSAPIQLVSYTGTQLPGSTASTPSSPCAGRGTASRRSATRSRASGSTGPAGRLRSSRS